MAIGNMETGWKGKPVTRGQLATFAFVSYLMFGAWVSGVTMRQQSDHKDIVKVQEEERSIQEATKQSHRETMESLREIHEDMKLLTKELVESGGDTPARQQVER